MVSLSWSLTAQTPPLTTSNHDSRYGIKAGIGYITSRGESDLVFSGTEYQVQKIKINQAAPQLSLGLWGQKKFGWLYAEGNALLSTYAMSYDVSSGIIDDVQPKRMSERFGYLDVQVMGGIISHGFRLGVGPVAHVMVGHDSDLSAMDHLNEKFRAISYGFSGSIGYNFDRVSIDLKYDKAFRTVGDHIYYGYRKSRFLNTPDAISLTVAYVLIK